MFCQEHENDEGLSAHAVIKSILGVLYATDVSFVSSVQIIDLVASVCILYTWYQIMSCDHGVPSRIVPLKCFQVHMNMSQKTVRKRETGEKCKHDMICTQN